MTDRRTNERRKSDKALRSIRYISYFIGIDKMCRKASTCPEFERRTINGIKGACDRCEYIKKERKHLFKMRILLLITFIAFIVTTFLRFHTFCI